MKKIERVVEVAAFSKAESDAIKAVGAIKCNTIHCAVCPLSRGEMCLRNELRDEAENLEVYDE